MVEYSKWISILFEEHPDADAQEVMRVGGREWTANKRDLEDATVREAREYARTL